MQTKILLKFKLWDTIFVVIFFYKIIYFLFFRFDHNLNNDDEIVLGFEDQSKA